MQKNMLYRCRDIKKVFKRRRANSYQAIGEPMAKYKSRFTPK